jgi:adenine deaminase
VAGVDDASMAACVARLVALGGGIAVADAGEVRGDLALPVAGLLAEDPAEAVVERLDALVALLRAQGVEGDAPFMTLSFLALSVIPELKLTDRGLVDVVAARVVPLVV